MPAPILHRDLWPTVWPFSSHNCHTREISVATGLVYTAVPSTHKGGHLNMAWEAG